MEWIKKGQVFKIGKKHEKLNSHASNPLAVHLQGDVFRVFFSSRDVNNRSSVGYVDMDIVKSSIINECQLPVLEYGTKDSYYSHGISIGNLYLGCDNENYILFMGWQVRDNQHWRGDIGRIKLIDKQEMIVDTKGVFMTTDEEDQVSLSYPFVIKHEGIYKMWYGSTKDWSSENGEMVHVIKYATSKDGESWQKHGVAIPYQIGVAQAFSKPSVIIDDKGYHMWYSYRSGTGTTYRVGYSFSKDGLTWVNKLDETGIDVSLNGWDSNMICYPFVFDHKGERYMLYNGNDYGKEGFGLAVMKK